MLTAVYVGAEDGPIIGDLSQPGQAEDLVAAAIGDDGAVPAHEAVEAPHLSDDLHPRTQHEVVGIAQEDVGPQLSQPIGGEGLYRALAPHGGKAGGEHGAVGGD